MDVKLTDKEADLLERPITEEEMDVAIRQLPSR